MLYGGADDDTIHGGEQNDIISGGDGFDVLYGDGGDDDLYGGKDDDYLYGGRGNDMLSGGSGRDTLQAEDKKKQDNKAKGGNGSKTYKTDWRSNYETVNKFYDSDGGDIWYAGNG